MKKLWKVLYYVIMKKLLNYFIFQIHIYYITAYF